MMFGMRASRPLMRVTNFMVQPMMLRTFSIRNPMLEAGDQQDAQPEKRLKFSAFAANERDYSVDPVEEKKRKM